MKIVGILLAKNEERFVERAVRNALDFCDEFLAVDNGSTDRTPEILKSLEATSGGRLKYHRASHPRVSHELIAGLAGSKTWVFGVDADEIYDPAGLGRFRTRLERGEFDGDWCLFGNVLNVRRLEGSFAEGHLAPPCRSMTKLYNFSAIHAWNGPCLERLHGGRVIFREGYGDHLRRDFHQVTSWEDADFRCLHVCFLPRSPVDSQSRGPRKNIMDMYNWSVRKALGEMWNRLRGKPEIDWKEQRYGRGPLVKRDVSAFFPNEERISGGAC